MITINIHTLIRNLLRTNIPGTIIKFIANYTNVRKAHTTYRNNTSIQRKFKTGVPQCCVLSPTIFNIYTAYVAPPRAPVKAMSSEDDITITSTHTSTSAVNKYIQPYIRNNLTLSPDKTTCTLYTPDPTEYTINLGLNINNTTHGNAPKVSGSYLRHKTHKQHTHSQHLSTRTQASANNKVIHRNRME